MNEYDIQKNTFNRFYEWSSMSAVLALNRARELYYILCSNINIHKLGYTYTYPHKSLPICHALQVNFPKGSYIIAVLCSVLLETPDNRLIFELSLIDENGFIKYISEFGYSNRRQFFSYEEIIEELIRLVINPVFVSDINDHLYPIDLNLNKMNLNEINNSIDTTIDNDIHFF